MSETTSITPSDEQQAIIDSKEDTIVVSNPGTGKTTTLSLKVIDLLEKGLLSPAQKILIQYDLITGLKNRVQMAINTQLQKYQEQIKSYKQNLSYLNPNEILSRGYSIVLNQNKKIINKSSALNLNDKIKIKFYDGNAEGKITKINQDKES